MRSTLELLGELAEQTRSLVQVEPSLLRAELREQGASISLTSRLASRSCLWRSAWRCGVLGFLRTLHF
jgi:hypothetical protein